jgi:hypothetical protein
MRLLHAKNLAFEEFVGDNIPIYATVSHRWGDNELSYQGFLKDKDQYQNGHRQGHGWTKIAKACELTLECVLEWVWLDTICINKESSAELTEAINSMYDWYQRAEACFVFLPDVHNIDSCTCELANNNIFNAGEESTYNLLASRGERTIVIPSSADTPFTIYVEEFEKSCWFERSWYDDENTYPIMTFANYAFCIARTLQELLAPTNPVFYNSNFEPIGTRSTLAALIEAITEIPTTFLRYSKYWGIHPPISNMCVAERMKLASRRNATRIEDETYSLLGLFQVNMPLLYGEGARAFRRLQMEIIKESRDESILASYGDGRRICRTLAERPRDFSTAFLGEIDRWPRKHFEITNMGIRFSVSMPPLRLDRIIVDRERKGIESDPSALFPLNCIGQYKAQFTDSISGQVALLLRIFASKAELDLKLLRAYRWHNEICILKDSHRWNSHHFESSESACSSKGNRMWINIGTGESAKFDIIIGDNTDENIEEYSLYIDTGPK